MLICLPVLGQEKKGVWSGSATINGGTNFDKKGENLADYEPNTKFSNSMGEVEATIGYKAPKFEVKFNAAASTSFIRTTKEAASVKMKNDVDIHSFNFDETQSERTQAKYKGRLDLVFLPSPADRISFTTEYNFNEESPFNVVESYAAKEEMTAKFSSEDGEFKKHTVKPVVEWVHKFDSPGRDLTVRADWMFAVDDRITLWDEGKGKIEWEEFEDDQEAYEFKDYDEKIYRITPTYIDNDITVSAKYRDRNFVGVKGLDVDFSLMSKLGQDRDYYLAANWIDEAWKDSTRFHVNFDYLALTVEPSVHANYKVGQFEFDGTFRLQYFTDRLNSETETERFDAGQFSPLVNFRTIWRPSESHKLTLNLNNTIQRPDYLNLCWFQRPGSYINELNEGNPNLRPAQTSRAALEYTFTKNRFSTSLEIGDSYVTNKIERTFRMEKIEDHDIRVYTWINGGFSNTANAKLNVRWSGRKLKAGASGNINYFIGINTSDKVTRNSDYRIEADASYNWFWDITYLARFRYQSKIIRSYSSITEYFGLDFRITKPFLKKKFEVFAEGRDLLDKPITTETYSEDGMEGRYETLNHNRRLFLLGLKYSF